MQRCRSRPSDGRPSILHQLQRWSIPGKHWRELRIRLFRAMHRMRYRKKKSPQQIYEESTNCCQLHHHHSCVFQQNHTDLRGSLRAKFKQHTPHRAVFRAPRGGGTLPCLLLVLAFRALHHPLVPPTRSLLVVVVSFTSAIPLGQHPLSVSAVNFAALSALAVHDLIRRTSCDGRYGPSGGATSGDANSGQCIIWWVDERPLFWTADNAMKVHANWC